MPSHQIPLTIILPVYQRQADLERALASLVSQSMLPGEVIVVDDCSPEPSIIPQSFADRLNIRFVRHAQNKGPAAARNTGLKLAEQPWISFLDSDDYLLPDSLHKRWSFVSGQQVTASGNSHSVYACAWYDTDPDNGAVHVNFPRPGKGSADFSKGSWFAPGSCLMFHRSVLGVPEKLQEEQLRRFEDYDWFLDLAVGNNLQLTVLDEPLVVVQRGNYANVGASRDAVARIMAKWQPRPLPGNWLRNIKAYLALEHAATCYRAGKVVPALFWGLRSLFWRPRLSIHFSPGRTRKPVEPSCISAGPEKA